MTPNDIDKVLREIQNELADRRDDRAIVVAMLNRLDSNIGALTTELRTMRSQFDRFRNEVREGMRELQELVRRIEGAAK